MDIVRLSVPGTLQYRHVVLRVVASVCRLVRCGQDGSQERGHEAHAHDFAAKVVSAVGEAFNNVAIHAYGKGAAGCAEVELHVDRDKLTVRLSDTGNGFSMSAEVGHELEALRESHMGIEIMVACMDEVTYARGEEGGPNVLTMTKRCHGNAHPVG